MPNIVFVIASDGTKLTPTNIKRARKLLKRKEAVIFKHNPFTIKLTRNSEHNVQDVECCIDTGDKHIGISIKSKKHEFVHAQYDNLKDETEKHKDKSKYRRTRRNRLRYRKARFNNRIKKEGWLAPSIKNKKDNHLRIFKKYYKVCPISSVTLEMGSFDTHAIREYEETGTVLSGSDYQYGGQYGFASLREAVFYRDSYTCQCCGKTIKDGAVFNVHHIGFWKGDRTNRMSNLMTVCTNCHTPKNHQPSGKLYGLKSKTSNLSNSAFMNIVRYSIVDDFRKCFSDIEIVTTYGALTKIKRYDLHLPKTHANDAYAMGDFHPKHRTKDEHFVKCRRNNRILSKFYDAKYIDIRDGKTKSGKDLSCNRTNRRELRNSDKNERIYRGPKISKGRISVRKQHYQYRPKDYIWHQGIKYIVKGVQDKGKRIGLEGRLPIPISKIEKCVHTNGWYLTL